MYSGSLIGTDISSPFFYMCIIICDLKLCVNCIELGSGARLSTSKETIGRFPQHLELEMGFGNISRSEE